LRLAAAVELRWKNARGGVERRVQIARFPALVALAPFARHLHPDALGQFLDRIEELEPVVLHQELERGAVRAAAEAVIELLGRRHRERRRALVVEGTTRRILAPGRFSGTRAPISSTMSVRASRSSMKASGIRAMPEL
jgi:hypothetical protein